VYFRLAEKPDSLVAQFLGFIDSVFKDDPKVLRDETLMHAVLEKVVGNCKGK